MSKEIRRVSLQARRTERILRNAGISRGRTGRVTRRIQRELAGLAARSPQFAPVKMHALFVKRIANSLARELQSRGVKLDRGLVNQAALAHDSRRDGKNPHADIDSQVFWAKSGAPEIGRTIPEGESWCLRNYRLWPLEKRLVIYGDNICRSVKIGGSFLCGILRSKTAFRLLISQRFADPKRVDGLVKERQAVLKFEAELRSKGVEADAAIIRLMKKNPPRFTAEVDKAIAASDIGPIVIASMKRLGIKRLDY